MPRGNRGLRRTAAPAGSAARRPRGRSPTGRSTRRARRAQHRPASAAWSPPPAVSRRLRAARRCRPRGPWAHRGERGVDNRSGHDGVMTLAAWPVFGPQPRDELADLSTARLSTEPLPSPPAMAAPAAPGAFEIVDGRGVYVRRVEGPEGATPAWYTHGLGGSS